MRNSALLCGWTGRLLHVDLNPGPERTRCEVRALDPELLRACLGGRGLGLHFLAAAGNPPWNHPETPVSFCAGALTGTLAPAASRTHLTAASPLSRGRGDVSLGGRFGAQLKRAGFDAVLFTGRSPAPCGLEIADGEARLVRAGELAGLGTGEIFRRLARFGSVACTGPAAEHGSPLALVAVDRLHLAGRTGPGGVLGAKNLRYVAVGGSGRVRVADKAALLRVRKDMLRLCNASPALLGRQGLGAFGTPAFLDLMDARRMMPTDNFRRTRFEHAREANAFALRERFRPRLRGCAGCPVACLRIADGAALPEFGALSHFTALIGNADLDLAVRADRRCRDLGLDPEGAAAALACLREVRGRDFGPDEVENLLADMAMNRGEAARSGLALGAEAVARIAGRPECAMTVKGLALGPLDPRGAYGTALALAVATRGGCVLRAFPVSHEILRKPVATERFSFSGKARMVKLAEDRNAALDSLGVCGLVSWAVGLEEYARAFAAATGLAGEEVSARALARTGEEIVLGERALNAAGGLDVADDDLPERFFAEPGTGGEGVGVPPLDRAAFLEARARYYRIRGLGPDGLPARGADRQGGWPWNAS